jgi:amino acid adenylation domain-containing protein
MVVDGVTGTIGARLASVAAQVPDNIAVAEGDDRITYREFDRAATAIARRLIDLAGDQRGRVVLFFDRKLPSLESIFAAGRSGCTYIALDAGDPGERLRFILQDCEPFALLTEGQLVERARGIAPPGCTVIDVATIARAGSSRPLPEIDADQPLMFCYTSGSTGRPKGVMHTHRSMLMLTAGNYARSLDISPADRLSFLYTMSFSAANNDMHGALLNGATLCAYNPRRDGMAGLADWLDRERITVLHTVPTLFRELCGRLPPQRVLPHLRVVDTGGESLFAADVALYKAHTRKPCILVNQLAASEVQLIAQYVITHDSPVPSAGIVPVGQATESVEVSIRRTDGTAADIDELGDIVVSSPYVSPGYWRRPELEAAAFAQSAAHPGWREYKGGDQGRLDADGVLHFVGRKGGRVKIRGHSVDLMEVEAGLSMCPGVIKAAVLAKADDRLLESERLVAYVVTRSPDDRVAQTIRRHLADRLPWYMVPSGMVFVDDLPMTASGKVDRAALSNMELHSDLPLRVFAPPQDDIEQAVAAIFADLMKMDAVGRDDDFFLLGGDSLLGVELQTQIADRYGVVVGNFHEDATVARIAHTIRRDRSMPATARRGFPTLQPLWQQGSYVPMFLVHGRNGQAFVSPHFMQLLGNEQPVWVFQARGLDGTREPHARVEEMAFDYLAELRKQRPHGPYFIASLCAGALIAAIMARSLRAAGETVLPLLLLDPPDEVWTHTYGRVSEQEFERMLKDPATTSARRVGLAFDRAVARHRPQSYEGPVYMLSSQQRAYGGDVTVLRKMFPGRVHRYVVGTTHTQALDPTNPAVQSALLECLARIREVASPGSAAQGTSGTGVGRDRS